MSRTIPSVVLNALDDAVFNPFFAVELLFDSPNQIRLWTGVGDLSHGGHTWTGSGTLMSVSAIEEGSDLAVRGATLNFSGITAELLSLALATPYQGRLCKIYLGVTSDETALTELFCGYMDQMNISEDPDSSSIELTVENRLIDLERPRIARYTSAYQKSVYPGDLGLDFVEDLQDKDIIWGKTIG
tara:strand:+ start:20441 stop:20998 length:558 start_codon:yes stop_codon:yes gene_type:complete